MTTNKRRIFLNQSNATIRVAHVENLTAHQIGGTINNDGKAAETKADPDPGKTPQNSIAIGVIGWSDYDLDD